MGTILCNTKKCILTDFMLRGKTINSCQYIHMLQKLNVTLQPRPHPSIQCVRRRHYKNIMVIQKTVSTGCRRLHQTSTVAANSRLYSTGGNVWNVMGILWKSNTSSPASEDNTCFLYMYVYFNINILVTFSMALILQGVQRFHCFIRIP